MRLLKVILTLGCLVLGVAGATAQAKLKFAVAEFSADPFDLSARNAQYKRYDGSGDLYAIIKVKSTNPDDNLAEYNFNFGNMKHIVEEHDGTLWIYVQRNAKQVSIGRKGYVPIDRYDLNTTIESGKNYVMVLMPEEKQVQTQMVQFNVVPEVSEAIIVVKKSGENSDDELFGFADAEGSTARRLEYGTYTYYVLANNYQTTSGRFSIHNKGQTHVENVRLKEETITENDSTGVQVHFNVEPKRAKAVIVTTTQAAHSAEKIFGIASNGNASKKMEGGDYSFTVLANNYHTATGTFTVDKTKGKQTVNAKLTPSFAEVTLTVDADAEIFIDDERKGLRQWTGDLNAGQYTVECRQANHSPSFQNITVAENENKTIELTKPTPILGTVAVTSSPVGANIRIDGQDYGTTPRSIDIIIGKHAIEVAKENYQAERRGFEVKESKTTDLDFTLSRITKTKIICTPQQSVLYIDNEHKGNTPYDFEGNAGMHRVRLFCSGYKPIDDEFYFGNDETMNFRLKKEYVKRTDFYLAAGAGTGSATNFAFALGTHIRGFNIEAGYCMCMQKSETIFWNNTSESADSDPQQCTYKPSVIAGGKLGYGIMAGERFKLTPQVGVRFTKLKEDSKFGTNFIDGAHCTSATIGLRAYYAVTPHFGVSITPEYVAGVSKSDGFKKLAELSSKIKNFGEGFNANLSLVLSF